jgi:hypothetical protein
MNRKGGLAKSFEEHFGFGKIPCKIFRDVEIASSSSVDDMGEAFEQHLHRIGEGFRCVSSPTRDPSIFSV